ncbi:MAG: hypothetical protein ACE5K8_02095, partial [Candidatus Zixiibacteriota bacterium]
DSIGQAQGTTPVDYLQLGEDCFLNGNAKMMFWAQLEEPPPPDEFRRGQRQRDDARERKRWRKERKYLEQFRLLKLLELLDLKEEQEVDFIIAFRRMRRERRDLHEKRGELVSSLAEGLREQNISDDEIRLHVQQISELAKQEGHIMEQFLTDAQKILTPQQLGKLIIFQERFEFELLEGVRAFRERQHGSFELMKPEVPKPLDFETKDSF